MTAFQTAKEQNTKRETPSKATVTRGSLQMRVPVTIFRERSSKEEQFILCGMSSWLRRKLKIKKENEGSGNYEPNGALTFAILRPRMPDGENAMSF